MAGRDTSVLLKVKRHRSSPRARELSREETRRMSRHRGVSTCRGRDTTAGQRGPAGSERRVGFLPVWCSHELFGGKRNPAPLLSPAPEDLTTSKTALNLGSARNLWNRKYTVINKVIFFVTFQLALSNGVE